MREARRDGFVAKMAIHPAQVAVINAAFTPSDEGPGPGEGGGGGLRRQPPAPASSGIDGQMLDRPHLLRAERLLARDGRG